MQARPARAIARPTPDAERLALLDALRGLALGGIFLLRWPVVGLVMLGSQVTLSRWRLARYESGPMEWLWRQATYGQLAQPWSDSSPPRRV